MTTDDLGDTKQLLKRLRDSQAYFLASIEHELAELDRHSNPSKIDLVKARAFGLAHAGHTDPAIRSFEVLVSQREGRTPRTLNKLAQLLVRRGGKADLEEVISLSKAALQLTAEADTVEQWFAHHNLAAAYLQQGKLDAARAAAETAQKARADPRTEALHRLATKGVSADGLREVRDTLQGRGLVSSDLPEDADVGSREGLVVILRVEATSQVVRPNIDGAVHR